MTGAASWKWQATAVAGAFDALRLESVGRRERLHGDGEVGQGRLGRGRVGEGELVLREETVVV